jgi:hypothetical protein
LVAEPELVAEPGRIVVRTSRLFIAALMAIVGVVWIGQGIGLIAGSFMTGSAFWAVAGVALLVAAVALVVLGRRAADGR